jgi:hypothetical protein
MGGTLICAVKAVFYLVRLLRDYFERHAYLKYRPFKQRISKKNGARMHH